jgi:DNA-binding NarL/FixJ family response regulator
MSTSSNIASTAIKHQIMIVDDHPVVRRGLRALLSSEPDVEVCGEADDVEQAIERVGETHPEVVVVDVSLKTGSGIRLIAEIKARCPDVKTLVWSMFDEKLFAERALRAGAAGYINKREPTERLIQAIRMVLRGEVYLSEPMTRSMLERIGGGKDLEDDPIQRLSDRELEVFEIIGHGNTTQEAARKLHLSPKTIEAHRERIKLKLDLKNGVELTRRAVQWVLEKG